VFIPERRVALAAIDAFTDLSAIQGNVVIDKTLHGSMVPRQARRLGPDFSSRLPR
jgi:hypothetical protein